ncbi:MAG: thiamine pyrophosphate-dependent enzyme [Promethearchaeota archaeon]
MDDLGTYAENTWCPGCGNFGILNAFKKAVLKLEDKGIKRKNIVISSGIGCSAKIFDYLNLSGVYGLHGRDMATLQGIKFANPDLKCITFSGDGNAMGEGLSHVLFAAKRNADITIIMHNNGVYALTTGQVTPITNKGWKGPSTPRGSVEEPFKPLSLLLEAGASFLARGYTTKIDHLADLMVAAIEHEGFSFIDVLQPCVSFNNTYKLYNEIVEVLDYEPKTYEEALQLAKRRDKLPIGVIYRTKKPVFHNELYGEDHNPITKRMQRPERIAKLKEILEVK